MHTTSSCQYPSCIHVVDETDSHLCKQNETVLWNAIGGVTLKRGEVIQNQEDIFRKITLHNITILNVCYLEFGGAFITEICKGAQLELSQITKEERFQKTTQKCKMQDWEAQTYAFMVKECNVYMWCHHLY